MNNNMQPIIKTTTKIPFFRRTVLQNFPFIEKDFDALTDYELLCKVVEYLNKVIEQTNLMEDNENELVRVYNELYNYVDNYFDNLDVQDEVNNKIEAMVISGEMQTLINETLFNSKMSAYKPQNCDIKLEYSNLGNYQAFTHTVDGKFVIVKIGETDSTNIIEEYNSEGTLLRSAYITAYHPNTICYADGYLYIGNAYATVNNTQITTTIVTKVNYSNFETTEIDLNSSTKVIGYYNNKFYVVDAYNTLKIYNSDFSTLISTNTIPNYGDIYQGICINDNHIILTSSYSFIVFLNHNLTLDKIINIRNFDYIACGELQDIDYYDNKIFILTTRTLGLSNTYWFIGSCDYINGNVNSLFYNQNINPYSNKTVYVNSNYTGVKQLGTQNNPFVDIEQAIFLLFNPYITGLIISIYNGTYGKVHLFNLGKPVEIVGRENKSLTTIAGMLIDNCSLVRIKNLTINDVYSQTNNFAIKSTYSNIYLDNVTFTVDNSIDLDYGNLHTGYSITVTNDNNMSVKNGVYTHLSDLLKNYTRNKTCIMNDKMILFSSSDGVLITDNINFTPYNVSNYKTLKMNLKITTAAAPDVTFYKTIIFNVSTQEKIDIFLKNITNNIFYWTVLTIVINFTNNRITGSYQSTTNIDGTNVTTSNQPVIKVLSIEEV